VASDLEQCPALGELDEVRPLVGRLEAMAEELLRAVGGLSLETLRAMRGTGADAGWSAGP
jgi:hypothetical protein